VSTIGYVTEFDMTATRAQGVLRWISRCWTYDDGPAERLVPRIKEIKRESRSSELWSVLRWTEALGLNGGETCPGSHVRRALILAGDTSHDRGPLLYRWSFERRQYELVQMAVR
jgi:hypothetical protein